MTRRQVKALALAHARATMGHEDGNRENHLARLDRLARLQAVQARASNGEKKINFS